MTGSLDRTVAWWRGTGGVFTDLDEILPFVVLHKLPEATDAAPTPMLIGARSLQAEVIGSVDPEDFRTTLREDWRGYAAAAIRAQRRISESGVPEIADAAFPSDLTGEGFRYRRGLFPVRTTTGLRLLLTHTERLN